MARGGLHPARFRVDWRGWVRTHPTGNDPTVRGDMAICLGVDTGGTYTDAVLIDDAANCVIASAKALTTRPDLAPGIAAAMAAVLDASGVAPSGIGLVSLSTTLATPLALALALLATAVATATMSTRPCTLLR